MRLSSWLGQHLAGLRILLVLTVITGLAYPLVLVAVGRLPGLADRADGSPLRTEGGTVVGSRLIGQAYVDAGGDPLRHYFHGRPSAAGDGYDPTASGAGNLGPESVVDTDQDTPSLLTQVCARSLAVGELEGVDGRRPYCTVGGVGSVLGVIRADGLTGRAERVVSLNEPCPAAPFVRTWENVEVECAVPGADYSAAVVVPVRGDAPADPVVPADAVTASGSGLDPDISVEYAELQVDRVAGERGAPSAQVRAVVDDHTTGRFLWFLGEPRVNVLEVNLELDRRWPRI